MLGATTWGIYLKMEPTRGRKNKNMEEKSNFHWPTFETWIQPYLKLPLLLDFFILWTVYYHSRLVNLKWVSVTYSSEHSTPNTFAMQLLLRVDCLSLAGDSLNTISSSVLSAIWAWHTKDRLYSSWRFFFQLVGGGARTLEPSEVMLLALSILGFSPWLYQIAYPDLQIFSYCTWNQSDLSSLKTVGFFLCMSEYSTLK